MHVWDVAYAQPIKSLACTVSPYNAALFVQIKQTRYDDVPRLDIKVLQILKIIIIGRGKTCCLSFSQGLR